MQTAARAHLSGVACFEEGLGGGEGNQVRIRHRGADAVGAGALAAHQASRDQRVKPMYDFTCQLAMLEPAPPHMRQLFGALRGNQTATNEFYSAITGSRPLQ